MLNPRIEYRGLTAVAANAAASARTLTIDTRQVDKLGICLTLTRIAATALTLTALFRAHAGGAQAKVGTITISGGTITFADGTWTKAVSGNDSMALELPCLPFAEVELVMAATGGGATDLLTLEVTGG